MTYARSLRLLVAALVALFASAASASAAAPAPAWKLFQVSQPTNFSPGAEAPEVESSIATPQYFASVTNVGGGSTTGSVEVVDTLPEGITPSSVAGPFWKVDNVTAETTGGATCEPNAAGTFTCSEPCTPSGQVVTCTVPASIAPGMAVEVKVPVDVTSSPASKTVDNQVKVSGGGISPVSNTIATAISEEVAQFGFLPGRLSGGAVTESGSPASIAGSHPYSLVLAAGFPVRRKLTQEELLAAGALRNLSFSLPPGIVANPQATPVRCTEAQLITSENEEKEEGCPPASQVGTVYADLANFSGGEVLALALYNMVPPKGVPAEFAFNLVGTFVHIEGGLSGDFHLTAESRDILAKVAVGGVLTELWGDPSDSRHNAARNGFACHAGCSVERNETAFLTMPSACSAGLQFGATATSWEDSTLLSSAEEFGGPNSEPVTIQGCESLQFAPTMSVQATSNVASSPTGLSVHIHLPQNEGIKSRATATLKKVTVQLPEGMTVNPAAADGLGACSLTEVGISRMGISNGEPAACPDSSKVGTAEIVTPLLGQPLKGSIYLAEQNNNPFSTLLALYLVVEGEGIVVKLSGRVDANQATGQLIATFDNNPQLPFSDLQVNFNSGARATLATPPKCETYNVRSELTSWASSTPVVANSQIKIENGCNGGGFNPDLQAGTSNPVAGSYSSFSLRVTQQGGEQNLSRITATLPEGLLAKLSGVPLCSDAQAASGNCPTASQVGTTTTGVGVGTQPLYIPQAGKAPTAVYLAGPYRGAPYSLVVKVPAEAGPFNLGVIAVRVALNINLYTAQVTATSDPLPQILEGIPVTYRDVRVNTNRENFVLNPTSCNPMQITSALVSAGGATASPNSRFQVAGCEGLAFKPQLKLSLMGSTKRTGHPALKAVVTYPAKGAYANIARAQVGLPHSEFLDQGNLSKVCTQSQLQTDTCPAKSIYGHAKAWTPLLEKPLEGPVYLGVGFGYKLPALVADLNGQVRILLKGKVDTTKQKGIRNTFEAVPDAPVSRFVLEMRGGKNYSLLENSENICSKPQRASALFTAQNGATLHLQPKIANDCKSGAKKGRSKK